MTFEEEIKMSHRKRLMMHASRCRARARLGTAPGCHCADRPLHRRRRQRPLPGYGV